MNETAKHHMDRVVMANCYRGRSLCTGKMITGYLCSPNMIGYYSNQFNYSFSPVDVATVSRCLGLRYEETQKYVFENDLCEDANGTVFKVCITPFSASLKKMVENGVVCKNDESIDLVEYAAADNSVALKHLGNIFENADIVKAPEAYEVVFVERKQVCKSGHIKYLMSTADPISITTYAKNETEAIDKAFETAVSTRQNPLAVVSVRKLPAHDVEKETSEPTKE